MNDRVYNTGTGNSYRMILGVFLVPMVLMIILVISFILTLYLRNENLTNAMYDIYETGELIDDFEFYVSRIPLGNDPREMLSVYRDKYEAVQEKVYSLSYGSTGRKLRRKAEPLEKYLLNTKDIWNSRKIEFFDPILLDLEILAKTVRKEKNVHPLIVQYFSDSGEKAGPLIHNLVSRIGLFMHREEGSGPDSAVLHAELKKSVHISKRHITVFSALGIFLGVCVIGTISILFFGMQKREQALILERALTAEDQAYVLENMVTERTRDLSESISTIKETQKRLVESEKMAALGNLIVGISHEINTPVGVCITAASYLEDHMDKISNHITEKNGDRTISRILASAIDAAGIITRNLNWVAHLLEHFRTISVDQLYEDKKTLELPGYLENMLDGLSTIFKGTHVEVCVMSSEKIRFTTYPGALLQIFTHLITNAKIHGFRDKAEGAIRVSYTREKDSLVFIYRENGNGMDADILSRLYDPFFTTARSEGRIGLGMNIVYNLVVQKLEGKIDANSSPGTGLEYVMSLPMNEGTGQDI